MMSRRTLLRITKKFLYSREEEGAKEKLKAKRKLPIAIRKIIII